MNEIFVLKNQLDIKINVIPQTQMPLEKPSASWQILNLKAKMHNNFISFFPTNPSFQKN